MTPRRLGWALAAYGVLGLLLLAGGGAVGLDAAGHVERLAGSADGALAAAIGTANAAAEAFRGTDASLGDGQASAGRAAALSREASSTLSALSEAMRLSVFGSQPLLPLSDDFAASAAQAHALGDELDAVGASLGSTRGDLSVVADRLAELGAQLSLLRDAEGSPSELPPLRLLLALVLTWLALPAAGALVAAGWLLRRAT